MAHTYANVATFNDYLRDAGSVTFVAESALLVARKLATLEASSRRVDEWCQRSRFGSGFGPRTGTNRYDGAAGSCVRLDDDLLSLTTATLLDGTEGTSIGTPVVDTDYYLRNGEGFYEPAPYREFLFHGEGTITTLGTGKRVHSFAGSWGYQDVRVTSASTTAEALDTSETGVDVTDGTDFSPGDTILVETEQMYVTSIATNTLTVVRAANGTTAATHDTAKAIGVYQYPSSVVDNSLRIAMRRWKGRDAGADGSDGGGDVPGTVMREGEDTILRRGLWQYAYRWIV